MSYAVYIDTAEAMDLAAVFSEPAEAGAFAADKVIEYERVEIVKLACDE